MNSKVIYNFYLPRQESSGIVELFRWKQWNSKVMLIWTMRCGWFDSHSKLSLLAVWMAMVSPLSCSVRWKLTCVDCIATLSLTNLLPHSPLPCRLPLSLANGEQVGERRLNAQFSVLSLLGRWLPLISALGSWLLELGYPSLLSWDNCSLHLSFEACRSPATINP